MRTFPGYQKYVWESSSILVVKLVNIHTGKEVSGREDLHIRSSDDIRLNLLFPKGVHGGFEEIVSLTALH